MADLIYTADFSQIAKEVRKNRRDLKDWATAVSDDLQRVNRNMTLVGKTSTLALNKMGKSMNRMGVLTQQAGYQIGDFVVQVQSGTNAFVAFGQQATQVAGTLTLLGGKWIAIGSALGVAIPLITAAAAAIMRTRQEAEKASDKLLTFEKVQESLAEKVQRTNLEIEKQAKGFGSLEEAFLNKKIKEAKAALDKVMAEVDAEIDKAVQDSIAMVKAYGSQVDAAALALFAENIRKQQLEHRSEELDRLTETYNELVRIRGIEEGRERSQQRQNDHIAQMVQFFKDAQKTLDQIDAGYRNVAAAQTTLTAETTKYLGEMAEVFNKAQDLREELGDAAYEALTLAGVDITSGVDAAAKAAASLAAAMGQTLGYAIAMQGMMADEDLAMSQTVVKGKTTDRFGVEDLKRFGYTEEYLTSIGKIRPSGGGGGRGGGVQEDRIGALAQSLATEKELLTLWYEDSLVQISEFNTKELELLGGQNEAKLRLEQEYQSRVSQIRAMETASTLNGYADLFGALGNLMGTKGKRLLQIQAGLSAAATMISSYQAAADAAAKAPTIAGKYAVWASFVAKGVSAVAKIKSLGSGGGGGGGGGGGRIATPATAAATPQRVLIQGIGPNDLITGSQLSEIFDRLYEENENRGLVFQIAS